MPPKLFIVRAGTLDRWIADRLRLGTPSYVIVLVLLTLTATTSRPSRRNNNKNRAKCSNKSTLGEYWYRGRVAKSFYQFRSLSLGAPTFAFYIYEYMLYALSSTVSACTRPKPKTKIFFNYFKSFSAVIQPQRRGILIWEGIYRNQELPISSAEHDAILMAIV